MADVIRVERILEDFLPVIDSNLTRTLDLVLKNGIFKANDIVVTKGTRELNAPSSATANEADRIADGKATKSTRGTVDNTCEIITKYVSLSDTENALEGGRLATEISDRILEIKQDLNMHIWTGTEKKTDPRAMGSLISKIPSSNKLSKLEAELTKEDFVAAVNKAKKAGVVDTIFGNYTAIMNIAKLLKASETRAQNDGNISLDISKIVVAGQELIPVFDESVPAGTVIIGNSKMLEFYALTQLRQVELARTGRTADYLVDMEATVVCRNPKNFYVITATQA